MSKHVIELHEKLCAEVAEIEEKQGLKPLRERAEKLRAQIAPLEHELRGIDQEIKAKETASGLRELRQEVGKVGQLRSALTAKTVRKLKAEPGEVGVTMTPLAGQTPTA